MVGVYLTFVIQQIMPPYLQSMYHYCELQVLYRIVLLMLSQLTGCICNHVSLLHQHTAKTLLRSVTIDVKTLVNISHSQHQCGCQSFSQLIKVVLALDHTNFLSFSSSDVRGFTILEKPSINLR
jgi:hypothetical protein